MKCNATAWRRFSSFFEKPVSQAREPAHRHSHRQILSLDKAGADVHFVRIAAHRVTFGSEANGRAVARFASSFRAVNLYELRVVDLSAECIFNGL
jgi:hypothetical protein